MAGNAGQLTLDPDDYPSAWNLTDAQIAQMDPSDPTVQALLRARAQGRQSGDAPPVPGTDAASAKLALEGMGGFSGQAAPLRRLLQMTAPPPASAEPAPQAGEPFTPGRMLMRTLLAAKGGEVAPAFDPDAYLATKTAAPAFDPDAYLATKAPGKTPDAAPGATSTFVRSAGHFPGVDQLAGAVGALAASPDATAPSRILLDPKAREAFVHDYRFIRDGSRADREAGAEAHPVASGLGTAANIGLSLAAPIPGGGTTPGATLLARLGQAAKTGAAYGGASGLLDGKADLTKGEIAQALLDTGVGATVGGVLGPLVHGAIEGGANLAGKLSAPLRAVAERMAWRATDGKVRDVRLATQNSGLSPGERLQQIGGQILDEGGVHFGDTPEKVAERLGPIRQRLGAEKGAAVDALDGARPLTPENPNRLGIHVPAADTLTAGPERGLEIPDASTVRRFGAPNPGAEGGGTVGVRDVPARNSPINVSDVPARAPAEYSQPASSPGMRSQPIELTPEVRSAPAPKSKTLLDRQVIAKAIDNQADALASKTGARGVAERLRAEAEAIRAGPDQRMTFQGAETLKTSYGKAFNKLGENDGNEARKMVYDVVKDHVEREAQAVSPELAGKFRSAKEAFSNLKPAEDAADNAEKRNLANQLGGILHVAGAGGAMAAMMAGRPLEAVAAGVTPLVYKAVQRRGPASTASAANALSKLLRRAPELGAKLAVSAPVAAERELAPALHLPPGLLPSFASDDDERARALQAALRAQR